MDNLKIQNGVLSANDSTDALSSSIYEVVRIRGGSPQFLAEHLDRLENSARLTGIEIDRGGIERDFAALLGATRVTDQNFRIDILFSDASVLIRPVASFYPPEQTYREGVDVVTHRYTRENPHAKVSNPELVEQVKRVREESGVFEIVLVDAEGYVTEGSRSNVFFIAGDRVVTSLPEQTLQGVTKQVVARLAGDRLVERLVRCDEIAEFDACFLTGTSIDLLPIRRVDDIRFPSADNPLYRELLERFRGER